VEEVGPEHRYGASENGNGHAGPAAVTSIKTEVTRQELAVIEFLNRVDRLYRELLELRDRELSAKDRLIEELERRAQVAEEHEVALRNYLSHLPEDDLAPQHGRPAPQRHPDEPVTESQRLWWQFWR
jgi:hypothetical protein